MRHENATTQPVHRWLSKRRGLLAGAAALVGAGLAKLSAVEQVRAGHDIVTAPTASNVLHLGQINDGGHGTNDESATNVTARTTLVASVSGGANAALRVRNLGSGGAGIHSLGASPGGDGVVGTGGVMSGAVGADDGRGVVAIGGAAAVTNVAGGIGLDATGGTAMNRAGGYGVLAQGGSSVSSNGGIGVEGRGASGSPPGDGVVGIAGGSSGNQGNGVRGETNSAMRAGVVGQNDDQGPGVRGESAAGSGVFGVSRATGAVNVALPATAAGVTGQGFARIGVQALSDSESGLVASSTSGLGVVGQSVSNYGVYGYSQNTNGIVGQSGGDGAALVGFTQAGIGVFGGVTGGGGGVAGYFDGPVFVKSLTVQGGAKSAAVKRRDGSHVRMYCMEAPESSNQASGEATLTNGRAIIQLDPEFDEVVRGDNYHVFLTEYAPNQQVYVADRRPHRFEVRSNGAASATGSFAYRVVARRADDVGKRMERVSAPKPIELREPPVVRNRPARPGGRD